MWHIKDNYFSIRKNTISLIFDITESYIKTGKILTDIIQPFILQLRRLRLVKRWNLPKVTQSLAALLPWHTSTIWRLHGSVHFPYWVRGSRKSTWVYSTWGTRDKARDTRPLPSRSSHWPHWWRSWAPGSPHREHWQRQVRLPPKPLTLGPQGSAATAQGQRCVPWPLNSPNAFF